MNIVTEFDSSMIRVTSKYLVHHGAEQPITALSVITHGKLQPFKFILSPDLSRNTGVAVSMSVSTNGENRTPAIA